MEYVIQDVESGALSAHTTLNGLFEMLVDDLLNNQFLESEDMEAWEAEFENYSTEQKMSYCIEQGYIFHKLTDELRAEYKNYWFGEGETI